MHRLLAAILFLSLFACKEISFKEPQPKGKKSLSQVPRELLGSYLVVEEKGGDSKDTLVVTEKGYYIPSDSSKRRIRGQSCFEEIQRILFF